MPSCPQVSYKQGFEEIDIEFTVLESKIKVKSKCWPEYWSSKENEKMYFHWNS